MRSFERIRNQKISEILSIIKIIYILLSIVAMISSNVKQNLGDMFGGIYIVVVLCVSIFYFLWMSSSKTVDINKKDTNKKFLELAILLSAYVMVLQSTGAQNSPYKFICIFVILITAIQYKRRYSLIISIICVAIILSMDFFGSHNYIKAELPGISISEIFAKTKVEMNKSFETDIVIISALLITSYIIGMYVNIEEEHSKELTVLANKDELTGVYNHRYFQENLTELIDKAEQNNESISLLFMDLDYFKYFNDYNGHQAGDLILKKIGTILRECVREGDIVARYGGEEFAAILPNSTEVDAIEIGEKIRTTIEKTYFSGQANQPNKNITISIGISEYPSKAKNKKQLLNTADDALYRAKSFNKNRVEIYYNIFDEISKDINVGDDIIKYLKRFANMISIKDRGTYGHTERVVIYAKKFGDYLKLSNEEKVSLKVSAYLHDLGKFEIPEEILNKKERLTDEEYSLLRSHPDIGVDLIKNIEVFSPFIPIIKHHHERYDGFGYPSGLKGVEIPYIARIITIVDSFDAMTSNRSYNLIKSREESIQELKLNSKSQFDPILVEKFIEMLNKEEMKLNEFKINEIF